MRSRVIIESPYAGDIARNTDYARRAMRDAIDRGDAPFASHLLYPQVLDENDPAQRELGIEMGLLWMRQAERVAVYIDAGISKGMHQGIMAAADLDRRRRGRGDGPGLPIEYRQIGLGAPPATAQMALEGLLGWLKPSGSDDYLALRGKVLEAAQAAGIELPAPTTDTPDTTNEPTGP